MNRKKISNSIMHWYVGRIAMDACLDEIEAEFARAHGKLHSDNLDLKKKVAWLNKLVIDLQIEVGRLRFKIAELEQERGEIKTWANIYASNWNDFGGRICFHEDQEEAILKKEHKCAGMPFLSTAPIRLPKKEEPKPEPVPFSRDDFVAMTPEQLEFARELTEPEEGIPKSVRAHLELLRKQADWQCGPTVEENRIARWLMANLRDEVKPKEPPKRAAMRIEFEGPPPTFGRLRLYTLDETAPRYIEILKSTVIEP